MGKTAMLWLALLMLVALPRTTQAQSTAEEIDYGIFWTKMPEQDKRSLLIGIRAGIMLPLVMLGHIQDLAQQQGDIRAEQAARDARELLKLGIFSVGDKMISLKELQLRIDVFYLDSVNRYQELEKAVYDSIITAAR